MAWKAPLSKRALGSGGFHTLRIQQGLLLLAEEQLTFSTGEKLQQGRPATLLISHSCHPWLRMATCELLLLLLE